MRLPTLAAGISLLILGCGEAPRDESAPNACAARVDCPNARVGPLADQCMSAVADPSCGPAYQAFFRCVEANQVCDGRGLVDVDASVARCAAQRDAWTQCVGGAADADADSPPDDTTPLDTGASDTRRDTGADTADDTVSEPDVSVGD